MAGMFAATGSMGAMAAEKITEAKAKEIALEDAGLSESDLIYDRIEMGHEQGASVYEIDLRTSTTEYDYDIAVADGEIVKESWELSRPSVSGSQISEAEAKEKADYVIVTIHWGTERMETPDELQIQHAIDLEEAGCDMIIGGHPHVLQTISWYEDMPIVYSLGNYFFSFDTRNTGVVQVSFDTGNKSLKSLRFVPMVQS